MSACYRTGNNKYFNAPPLMSDGRHFTDYRSSCVANSMFYTNKKLTNSFDYRNYLTQNAKNIIKRDRQVNYLNLGVLNKSLWINNVNKIIINKYDILNTVNEFKLYEKGKLINFNDFASFKSYVNKSIITNVNWLKEEDITWSCNPCTI